MSRIWEVLPYFLIALIIIAVVAVIYLAVIEAVMILSEIGRHFGIWTLIAILIVVIVCCCSVRKIIVVK